MKIERREEADQKMRDGCWHCKKWEEHFYWEHMEETSFHFMIVMVGDFSQSMELPRKFAKNFRVDLLYVIVLVAPNGKMWEVELCEEQDQFYFKGGWREFIEACGIEENYVLVFKYAGDSSFNVQIFDQTGCARVASNFIINYDAKDKAKKSCLIRNLKMVDETPRKSQRSQPCKDQICSSSRVACHDDPMLHEIFEDDEKVGSYKIVKQEPFELHSQSSSETKWSMDDSHDNLKMLQLIFSSKYDSSFAKIIKPSVVRENPFMAIPRKFFSKHFRQKPDQIVLCDQSKKKWVMICRLQYGGAWGFSGKSLQYFVQENNLEVGDACAFKLIKTSKEVVMDVRIVRAAEIGILFRKP